MSSEVGTSEGTLLFTADSFAEGVPLAVGELLRMVFYRETTLPDRASVEASLGRLAARGFLARAENGDVIVTAAGASARRPLRRRRDETQIRQLQELVDGAPPTAPELPWVIDDNVWVTEAAGWASAQRSKLMTKIEIFTALQTVVDRDGEFHALVRRCADRSASVAALAGPPFQFSEVQAHYVLDMSVGRFTEAGRAGIADELQRLQAELIAWDNQ